MKARKAHWEIVYATKPPGQRSWTQECPTISLDFVHQFNLPKQASIIDIGGGDSKFVDCLLDEGFENITVLDISELALAKAKKRLGKRAAKVKWIAADITEFKPAEKYDLWHDRATFHFLRTEKQIQAYLTAAKKGVKRFMTIATFSDKGPKKCSGLYVHQYNEKSLQSELSNGFKKIGCVSEDHITPFHTKQNFLFCSFKRRNAFN